MPDDVSFIHDDMTGCDVVIRISGEAGEIRGHVLRDYQHVYVLRGANGKRALVFKSAVTVVEEA
jgi:hypothetical protein